MHSADPGWPFHVIGAVVDAAQWAHRKAKERMPKLRRRHPRAWTQPQPRAKVMKEFRMNREEMERFVNAVAKASDYTLGKDGAFKAWMWAGDMARAIKEGDREEQARLYAIASRKPGEF